MKPTVHYYKDPFNKINVGSGAFVHPINHPNSSRVSNTKFVFTSPVVALLPDGFETINTIYKEYQ